MNRIILEPKELTNDHHATLSGSRATHVHKVLKLKEGDMFRIGLLNGPIGLATIVSAEPNAITIRCSFENDAPVPSGITLVLAMPRPKILKRLWAQLSALGVDEILITNAEKVERYYFDTHVLEENFYTSRLIEGLQQSGTTLLPNVSVHRELKPLVEDCLAPLTATKLLAHPGPRSRPQDLAVPQRVVLSIGPEGGWIDYERDLFENNGFESFSIGERTLRTDTASVVLLAIVKDRLGEIGQNH